MASPVKPVRPVHLGHTRKKERKRESEERDRDRDRDRDREGRGEREEYGTRKLWDTQRMQWGGGRERKWEGSTGPRSGAVRSVRLEFPASAPTTPLGSERERTVLAAATAAATVTARNDNASPGIRMRRSHSDSDVLKADGEGFRVCDVGWGMGL